MRYRVLIVIVTVGWWLADHSLQVSLLGVGSTLLLPGQGVPCSIERLHELTLVCQKCKNALKRRPPGQKSIYRGALAVAAVMGSKALQPSLKGGMSLER